jgi:hypothetical protein
MAEGQRIFSLISSVMGSIGAIASGSISAAVAGVETSLAKSIPVALSFLSRIFKVSGIGTKVKNIIQKVKGRIDKVVSRVMDKAAALVAKVMGSAKPDSAASTKPQNSTTKPAATPNTQDRNKQLSEAEKIKKLKHASSQIRPRLEKLLRAGVKDADLTAQLQRWKTHYDLTDLKADVTKANFSVVAVVNPEEVVLGGISATDQKILQIVNKLGKEIFKRNLKTVSIKEQVQKGKGRSAADPIIVESSEHFAAAIELRDSIKKRGLADDRYYKINGVVVHQNTRKTLPEGQDQTRNLTTGEIEVQVPNIKGGRGRGSYQAIASLINKIKSASPDLKTDSRVALGLIRFSTGQPLGEDLQPYKSQFAALTHLFFNIEPSRNDSVAVFTPMLLQNIASGSMTFEQAFKSLNRTDKGKTKPDGGMYPPSQRGAVRAMDDVDIALSQGAKRNNAGAANQAKRQAEFIKIWIHNKLIDKEIISIFHQWRKKSLLI